MAFSSEVHHVLPIHKGGAIFDPRNLIAVCHACHKTLDFLAKTKHHRHNNPREGVLQSYTAAPVLSRAILPDNKLDRLQWQPRVK